jgi:DHA1 family tetracycline resistance protein-like MFS transporter
MPARRAALVFIFITVVLDMLAFGVVIPLLPKLVLQFEGGDTAQAAAVYGLFGGVFAAMQFLFAPLLGALSDRFGRRRVILLSNLSLGLDYVIMALAPSVGWLLVGRVLSGICSASFSIPGAYIADVTPKEKRAASFGMLGAAFGLGFVVGPAFGGVLGQVNPRLPFWVAAGLSLANFLYGFFILPESLPPERRAPLDWRKANPVGAIQMLRRHRELFGIAGVVFLSALAHEVLPSLWVLYTDYRFGWDTRTVGLTLAGVGVCSAVVQAGVVGVIVKHLGESLTLRLGLLFGTAGFSLSGLAATSWLFCAAIPLVALWGIAGPSAQALMSQRVDASEQGRLQGAIAGLQGVAYMIGPVLFTGIFAASVSGHGRLPGTPFLLSALLLAGCFALALRVARPVAGLGGD